jgi:hypothetical protein
MIEAEEVVELKLALQPVHPPPESSEAMEPPSIDRSSPELAGGREVIRGHSTLLQQPALTIQGKQPSPAPGIGAVVGHIERDISEKGDAKPMGLRLQALPLPLQMPLEQGFL